MHRTGGRNPSYHVIIGITAHDDVIKWKHFPRYWSFVRGIHRSPVNSPHKGQWRGAFFFFDAPVIWNAISSFLMLSGLCFFPSDFSSGEVRGRFQWNIEEMVFRVPFSFLLLVGMTAGSIAAEPTWPCLLDGESGVKVAVTCDWGTWVTGDQRLRLGLQGRGCSTGWGPIGGGCFRGQVLCLVRGGCGDWAGILGLGSSRLLIHQLLWCPGYLLSSQGFLLSSQGFLLSSQGFLLSSQSFLLSSQGFLLSSQSFLLSSQPQVTGLPPQLTGLPPELTGLPPQLTGLPPQQQWGEYPCRPQTLQTTGLLHLYR